MTEEPPAALAYLDAMTFILFVEGKPSDVEPVRSLFEALRARRGVGVTSELTLAEVLAGSDQPRLPPVKRAYLDLLVWSKFLDVVPISRHILCESAELRFRHKEAHSKKLSLPDSVHLYTAMKWQCLYFVSADKGIRPPVNMKRVAPDADGVAEIMKVLA